MKRLLVAAALAPLSFAAMSAVDRAHAAGPTSISTATTTPLATSTAGDVTITSSGSISLTAGPAAVTVDANGNVSNAGVINLGNVSNATGVLIDGGFSGNITNTGSIALSESTTGDSSNQSIANGPFANGSNRFGIQVVGTTPFTGSIANSGTITITGENSAGITIGTELTGALTQTGAINVTGGSYSAAGAATNTNNDISYGINATGKIDGNVTIGGAITATGQNAIGAALDGGVGGGVLVDGTITATGYRSTTPPTDPTVVAKLTADQTLQGGPALEIGGNVVAGVTLAAPAAASGNVSAVTPGVLTVYGSAPALLIGGANAITLGANAGGFGLQVGGTVTSIGDYPDISATGIQIGGTNKLGAPTAGVAVDGPFGAVTMANGIDVTGTVTVTSESHTAGKGDATGILIGSGANVSASGNSSSALTITGVVSATTSSDALYSAAPGTNNEFSVTGKLVPVTASAITVASGNTSGNLTSINNSGTISAAIVGIPSAANYTAAGGVQGQAIAINDQSGSLTSVTNTNIIAASITPIIIGQAVDYAHSDIVAMYLANVGGNVTVTQLANGNTSISPTIIGDVIFGNTTLAMGNATNAASIIGAENLDLEAGVMNGYLVYNGVGNNSLKINGGATLTGALSQAAAGNLTLNVLNGTLYMTAPTSTNLGVAAPINSPSLHIGANGQIIFTINPLAANALTDPQFNVSGVATLDQGAKIGAGFTSKLTNLTGATTYHLITAGSVVAPAGIDATLVGALPYLYSGVISTSPTAVDLNVSVKSGDLMGLNPAQKAAFAAIYTQLGPNDLPVLSDVLSQTTRSGFLHIYNQFLPDYAGGPFEAIASGQRAIARAEAEAPVKLLTNQTRGWVQEIGYLAKRDSSSRTNGYETQGFGIAGGIEQASGDSAVGVAAAFMTDAIDNSTQSSDGTLSTVAIEGGVYWRAGGEGLNASASINGGYVALGSHRLLLDQNAAGAVTLLRAAKSHWSGAVGSAQLGVGYQVTLGRFYLRPEVSADYVALYETSHSEKGGGPSLNLGINSRMSTEAAAQGDLVLGYSFGDAMRWRPELTVGYRQIIYGGPASTTAHFLAGGSNFTLTPDLTDRGGLLARLGVRAIGNFADITADAGGEVRNGYQTYDARAVARFLF